MKRTRHVITDKNGNEQVEFVPTGHMIVFAIEKAKSPGDSDHAIAERAGMKGSNPSTWAKKYGVMYLEWLEEFIETSHFSKQAEVLEAVGMVHATQGSYSFWKDMARKHGVIADEQKEVKVTISTDFSQVLMAVGNNFEAAKAKMLADLRGVKDTKKTIEVEAIPVETKKRVKAKR